MFLGEMPVKIYHNIKFLDKEGLYSIPAVTYFLRKIDMNFKVENLVDFTNCTFKGRKISRKTTTATENFNKIIC
jgi:hypothetical protein